MSARWKFLVVDVAPTRTMRGGRLYVRRGSNSLPGAEAARNKLGSPTRYVIMTAEEYDVHEARLKQIAAQVAAEKARQREALDETRMECQVCARKIMASSGVIAHHGYQRPGGWQTASCRGARRLPYEISNDAIPAEIALIQAYIKREREYLDKIKGGAIAVPNPRYNPMSKFSRENDKPMIEPGDEKFAKALEWNTGKTKDSIRSARQTEKWLQDRFDNWRLKP